MDDNFKYVCMNIYTHPYILYPWYI